MAWSNETIRIGDVENQRGKDILSFPEDAVYEPNVPEGRREGKVEVFKDGLCIAVLFYKNGKLNGLCKFYENAKLQKQITFVNGKIEGWSKEGNEQYLYKNNKREVVWVNHGKLEGYVYEKDIKTGKVNRCYKMNENHKPVGVGYVYTDGEVSSVVNFKEDSEPIVMKEFKDGKMFERDESGNVIYEGEFLKDDCLQFPRHGNGKEKIGDEMYIGNWNRNHKEGEGRLIVKGHLRYEGMWKNDVANGKGCLYDDNDNVVCEGEWKKGVCEKGGKEYHYINMNNKGDCFGKNLFHFVNNNSNKVNTRLLSIMNKTGIFSLKNIAIAIIVLVLLLLIFINSISSSDLYYTISSADDLEELLNNQERKESISRLIISKNSCNDMDDDLVLSGFDNLEKIIVREKALQNVNSLRIHNCEKLKSIEVENEGFCNVKKMVIESVFC